MSGDSSPIRILTVDDHPLGRKGIASLIADQPDMTLVAEASNGVMRFSSSVRTIRTSH
jgi:DNA-binding NarL/FixJ family response regulator